MTEQLTPIADAKQFMLAGKAIVTFRSRPTGKHYTYKVEVSDDNARYYVRVLTGPDNHDDYKFLGTIFADKLDYRHGKKSPLAVDAPSAKAFVWAWNIISMDLTHPDLEVFHSGQCCRCGRKLTTPESISRGLGPECSSKMGGE